MRVTCQRRKRSDLAHQDCKILAAETAYELDVGRTYTVYGQYLDGMCLLYLIDALDRQGLSHPTWYPAEFFALVDGALPTSWGFIFRRLQERVIPGVVAVWGYPELVMSEDHFSNLQEREEEAMLLFLRRKAEIDLEQNVDIGADKTK